MPYQYRFELAHLNESEQEKWDKETKEISRLVARLKSTNDIPSGSLKVKIKKATVRRAKIAKKAHNKVAKVIEVIKEYFKEGQKWLLFVEDGTHLQEIESELQNLGYGPMRYEGNMLMDERDATIEFLTKNGGIIVSMKCLDEGVDIPSISHSIIVSSSQNPRQFVQRRGRVLRKAGPEKNRAHIWDILVLPRIDSEDSSRSLILAELKRAHEFASFAENYTISNKLQSLLAQYDLDLEDIVEEEYDFEG